MAIENLQELLLESLEHKRGGVQVFETALKCIVHEDLREEWQHFLAQTRAHERLLLRICSELGIDPETETPGRVVVRQTALSFVEAMQKILAAGDPNYAELVAYEGVVLTETQSHADWELLARLTDELSGPAASVLRAALAETENRGEEHANYVADWCRGFWLKMRGMKGGLTAHSVYR